MTKQNKKTQARVKPNQTGREPSYWKIMAIVAIVFSAGLLIKVVFFSTPLPTNVKQTYESSAPLTSTIDLRVQQVASNFRCACGGCGELPLDECACDMPRGAVEEKNFIRKKLNEGLTTDAVINLVNERYGHLKT
ncbi:MAG: hypothetical protein H8D61_01085 [Deltaproteobacteria bacterium]|nr:hypothetical protein [Deltaproteobacteria bacterium]